MAKENRKRAGGAKTSGPVLGSVVDAQYLDALLLQAINGDVGERREQEFSSSTLAPQAATERRFFQGTDGVIQLAHGRLPALGMAVFEVIADVGKVRCSGGRPADAHLWAEHLLQQRIHFFFLNELAPIGLCNALTDGGAKTRIFVKQPQRGILHQPLRIDACIGSNLRKLRFLLKSEMNFHRFQSTQNHAPWQPAQVARFTSQTQGTITACTPSQLHAHKSMLSSLTGR
jgi:hypothetical protein